MSHLKDRHYRQDTFYRRAKQESYAARSVYKLQEIQKRFRVFKSGQKILDLGCRPGSWLQFAADQVGPKGFVVGLDRQELDIALPPNVTFLIGDVFQIDPALLLSALPEPKRSCFNVILSDMAPDTSGVPFADQARSAELFLRAFELATILGGPGSHFVGKLFMGEGFEEIWRQVKARFNRTKTVRPEATRKSSTELYIVALELKK